MVALNIINENKIKDWLRDLIEGRFKATPFETRERLIELHELALLRSIKKMPELFSVVKHYPDDAPEFLTREKFDSGTFHQFDPTNISNDLKSKINHIQDWLLGAINRDDDWLHNCDDQNRPYKLLSIGSLQTAYNLADKNMKLQANKLRSQFENSPANFEHDIQNGHIKIIKEYPDGFRIVQLLTPHALDFETAQLGHCIGNDGYDDALNDNDIQFYSFRDPNNKSIATFEIENAIVVQCKGKQNAPPTPKYMGHVKDFIIENNFGLTESAGHTGLLKKDGIFYEVNNLPDDFAWEGDLDISEAKWLKKLPSNLSVGGELYLTGCTGLMSLPENLSVGGRIYWNSKKFTSVKEFRNVEEFRKVFENIYPPERYQSQQKLYSIPTP
jgi:hypothetical protein